MRAVVQDRYGSPEVLHLDEVERPVPGDGEVLIRVRASTVSQTDTHIRRPSPWVGACSPASDGQGGARSASTSPALSRPSARGSPSSRRRRGLRARQACSVRTRTTSALAEYAPIAKKPANLSFEEAAAVGDGAMQALATLRRSSRGGEPDRRLRRVRLARDRGRPDREAPRCICHGRHEHEERRARASLGADEVIDYTREDLTQRGPVFDVVIDAVGKYAFHWGQRR